MQRGTWTGDDYMGDSDGYGYSSGDGDGLVEDRDGAIWFDIEDTGDTDNDGLTYWEEVNMYGTDPTVNDWTVDSDRDGMSNAWEIKYGLNHKSSVGDNGADGDPDQDGLSNIQEYNGFDVTIGGVNGVIQHIQTNPTKRDILLEIDYMGGHQPTNAVLQEAIDAFADAGITLHYVIDERNLAVVNELPTNNERRDYLETHRNVVYAEYVHVIFANYYESDTNSQWHTVTGINQLSTFNPNDPAVDDVDRSGVIIFHQILIDFLPADGTTQNEGIAKCFIHELGHSVGCSHETDDDGELDTFNVMIQGHYTDPNTIDGPNGNGPRFATDSQAQMDLTLKLSVETGYLDLTNFVDVIEVN